MVLKFNLNLNFLLLLKCPYNLHKALEKAILHRHIPYILEIHSYTRLFIWLRASKPSKRVSSAVFR